MGTVQTAQCLHSLHIAQFFIHKHRMQQGFIESCLIFVGHDQYVVEVGGEEKG